MAPLNTINPILYDQDKTVNAVWDSIDIPRECRYIRLYPVSGVPTIAINTQGNTPLLRLYEAVLLENVEEQIHTIHIYSAASSTTNIKLVGLVPGIRVRTGRD